MHGLLKVPFPPRHHHFLSFSLALGLVVRPFVDLWRKGPYKVDLVRLVQFFSSLVAGMRMMTSYTEISGCLIHEMAGSGCFRKRRAEDFTWPSQGSNNKRSMCSIRCERRARGSRICCVRGLPSMLLVLQLRCPLMYFPALRKLCPRKMVFQGNLL